MAKLRIAQDEAADRALSEDPFALLSGMLLDQQFPMERAFAGPAKILERLGTLDPAEIAAADPEQFAALCSTPPAVHRFPGSMAARIQALAAHVVSEHGADVAAASADHRPCRAARSLPGCGRAAPGGPRGRP